MPIIDSNNLVESITVKKIPLWWLCAILFVLTGAAMQGYANGTIHAFFVAFILLIVGVLLVRLFLSGRRQEMRVFLITFGICIFVGGLAQCYSLAVFKDVQSTNDAIYTFFPAMASHPPFTTMNDIPHLLPLGTAIMTWQQVYKLAWVLGFTFGPYIGVMFNAFVMGLTGSVTVRIARELFVDDAWRLRRVGTLFAFCGLFILFGSIFLRDCFTTFFNALLLLSIVQWLVLPNLRNLLFAILLTAICIYAIIFLRFQSTVLFALYWFLAFLFWFVKRRLNITRFFAVGMILITLLFSYTYLNNYIQFSMKLQSKEIRGYETILKTGHKEDSIAMRLVVNQLLPIRLVLGTGSLMVYPIPLWGHFFGSRAVGHQKEYHLIKGYHGIYQVLVLPLVFFGFIKAFSMFGQNRQHAIPLLFLAVYLLMNILGVVATSLEQRHIAQFMPAMIILAAVPDTRERKTRKTVRDIAIGWFLVVVLIHIAWALVALGR
jgi:hypothetical protein